MALADGLLVLSVSLLFLLDHTHNVFPINEGLKAAHGGHIVQWKHILCFNWNRAIVLIGLHHDHPGSQVYEAGTDVNCLQGNVTPLRLQSWLHFAQGVCYTLDILEGHYMDKILIDCKFTVDLPCPDPPPLGVSIKP